MITHTTAPLNPGLTAKVRAMKTPVCWWYLRRTSSGHVQVFSARQVLARGPPTCIRRVRRTQRHGDRDTRTHRHRHRYTQTYTHRHTHTHMHERTHACTHARTHTRACTHAHAHTRTHARTHTRTHTHTLTHSLTHTHTHTCIHAHTLTHSLTHTHIDRKPNQTLGTNQPTNLHTNWLTTHSLTPSLSVSVPQFWPP